MTEQQSYDDIIRQRLSEHESDVPTDMFERLTQKRKELSVDPDNIIKDKLADYESEVPAFMFDTILGERDDRLSDMDNELRNKLTKYESKVPADMFERIMRTREGRRPVIAWWKNRATRILVASLFISLCAGGYLLMKKNTNAVYLTNTPSNAVSKYTESSIQSSTDAVSKTEGIIQKKGKDILESDIPKMMADINNLNNTVSKTSKITSNIFDTPPVVESPTTPNNSSESPLNESVLPTLSENQTLKPLTVAVGKGIDLSTLSHEKVLEALPCPGPDYGCPTFQRKKLGSQTWYLDIYGAPEYAFRRLQPISNEYVDYRNARDTVESAQYAFSTGIRASVRMGKGLILRGGVVYAQNNEKFQKDSFGIGNIRYIIDRNPATGRLDTVEIQVINGIFRKIRYNRYRSLDFTIQAGYEFELNENTHIGINGGVNFNYRAWQKGTILGQNLQAQPIEEGQSIYRSSIGSSVVGSISIYKRLSDRWQLMIEPQFRFYLKPMTQPDYVLRQNYMNAGLHVGLRYSLTR